MLEEFQFSICTFGKNRGGKGLHDLLDSNGSTGQLVLGRTHQTKCTHPNWLQVNIASCYLKNCPKDAQTSKICRCHLSLYLKDLYEAYQLSGTAKLSTGASGAKPPVKTQSAYYLYSQTCNVEKCRTGMSVEQ